MNTIIISLCIGYLVGCIDRKCTASRERMNHAKTVAALEAKLTNTDAEIDRAFECGAQWQRSQEDDLPRRDIQPAYERAMVYSEN